MSKDSYSEICKYFGIDKVQETIRHRHKKLKNILAPVILYANRYSLNSSVLNYWFCIVVYFLYIYFILFSTMW